MLPGCHLQSIPVKDFFSTSGMKQLKEMVTRAMLISPFPDTKECTTYALKYAGFKSFEEFMAPKIYTLNIWRDLISRVRVHHDAHE